MIGLVVILVVILAAGLTADSELNAALRGVAIAAVIIAVGRNCNPAAKCGRHGRKVKAR